MFKRKSDVFFLCLAFLALLLASTQIHAWLDRGRARQVLAEKREMVRRFELTDLCLFTDARYTRNPSQTDRYSHFQDHPLALEHFPSGSLVPPPPHLQGIPSALD